MRRGQRQAHAHARGSEADALELAHDLNDDVAPDLVRFLHLLLAHKVEMPVVDFGDSESLPKTNPTPNPGGDKGGFPGNIGPMSQNNRDQRESVQLYQFPGGNLGLPGGQKGMPGGNLGMPALRANAICDGASCLDRCAIRHQNDCALARIGLGDRAADATARAGDDGAKTR